MVERKVSNYDYMRDKMQTEFLKYNIEPKIRKYQLRCSSEYLYIRFVENEYRIDRTKGAVERLDSQWIQADYNESMTIFDVLCYAKDDAELAGEYAAVNRLKGVVQTTSGVGNSIFTPYMMQLAGKSEKLKEACRKLGGKPCRPGDVAFELKLFDFLPVIFQFWDADEEFDAQMVLKWDSNILDFMHYETTFFAACCLLKKIMETME